MHVFSFFFGSRDFNAFLKRDYSKKSLVWERGGAHVGINVAIGTASPVCTQHTQTQQSNEFQTLNTLTTETPPRKRVGLCKTPSHEHNNKGRLEAHCSSGSPRADVQTS